jgi:accessory gene regulator protein AgrB
MPKFLLGWLLGLGGNAIGLVLASLILGKAFTFSSVTGFVVSLVIFAILSGLFTWLVFKFLIRNAGSVVALTGLVATFLALLVTSALPWGDLDIDGMGWIWGTLIVWVCGMFIWLIPGPWRNFKKVPR